jgi:CIC family chloride channel protein
MIQFAAAISSWVGERSPLRNLSLRRQVAYGAAAAVAAAYQAPIAGVFFALEIVLGEWAWNDLAQLFLASGTGWLMSRLVLGAGPLFPVRGSLPITHDLLWAVPLALVLGAVGPAYQKLLHFSGNAKRLPFALLWSGMAVGVLALIEPKVWGNGDFALLEICRMKRCYLVSSVCLRAAWSLQLSAWEPGPSEECLLRHSSRVQRSVSRRATYCTIWIRPYWPSAAWGCSWPP